MSLEDQLALANKERGAGEFPGGGNSLSGLENTSVLEHPGYRDPGGGGPAGLRDRKAAARSCRLGAVLRPGNSIAQDCFFVF